MPLTVEQDERLVLLLQALGPCLKDMKLNSRRFVEDQIARHETYGARVLMSSRQWAWLEDLYKSHVGGELPGDDDHRDAEHTARGDIRDEEFEDDGDEIPF